MPERRRRLIGFTILAIALGLLACVQWIYFGRGVIPGDAFNYLAAGERLNAGHPLYALSPGDRWVDIKPPYWTVPLVSPPPIAVVHRVFALLPNGTGAFAWWILQLMALGASLTMLAYRRPGLTGVAILVLLIPTVYEIGVGNLNSFLLLGAILTWRFAMDGRERAAGAIAGVATAFKLTPAVLVWWLLVTRRWKAVGAAAVAGAVVLAISVLGAGLDSHLEYLRLLRTPGSFAPSPLSLGGMAAFVGVPDGIASMLPNLAIVIGLVAVALLRNRPGLAFAAAILTMIYGSPAVSINWYVMLYALLAPACWPAGSASTHAASEGGPALGASQRTSGSPA